VYICIIIVNTTKYLIVIAGPTAVGKTTLSIELAKHYNSSIISADSRQFYSEMTIGTAKPSEDQLKQVEHYFIGNKTITELYGAGHFEKEALHTLKNILQKQNVAIMVGGSGLYIDAVLNGVDDFIEIPSEVREKLNAEFELTGREWLQKETEKHDPLYFSSSDIQNPQRLIRALEVYRHTGRTYSSFLKKNKPEREFIPIKILINTRRDQLYANINDRVDKMINNGLVNEVKHLSDFKNNNALKTVGYKELFEHLAGFISLNTAIDKIKQHTRNYAKRQLTWFRNKDHFTEFEPDALKDIIQFIDKKTLLSE